MDHGTLTDNNGKKSDFRHVLIMTSNVGARELGPTRVGFGERGKRATTTRPTRTRSAPSSATASTRASMFKALDPR
jgi:ATP-dependent Clp protease ATP-binding subunit ClpA